LEDFEDEWIQVETEMHYTHNGSFSITLSRLSDGKRLVQRSFDDIDLWRKGAISIRNKFGIYRSFGKTLTDENESFFNVCIAVLMFDGNKGAGFGGEL
jgi:hypothetical protein